MIFNSADNLYNSCVWQTRRYVAEWHCAYLFGLESQSESRVSKGDRRKYSKLLSNLGQCFSKFNRTQSIQS